MGKQKVREESEEEIAAREMTEEIASNLSKLADSVGALLEGRLNKRAIVLLLAASSRLSQAVVEQVLKAIVDLEKDYLKKK